MSEIIISNQTEILLKRICNLYEKETGKSTNTSKMITAIIRNIYEGKFND